MDPTRSAAASRISPLLERRVRHIFSRLPKAFAGDEDAIHELRIAARRLRVVLPLLVEHPKGRRVRHTRHRLRDLTRAFGESRDLDVVLPLLLERVRALEPAPERAALVKRLRRERKRVRHHMARSVAELDPHRLRAKLRKVVRRADASAQAIDRLDAERRERGRDLQAMLLEQGSRFDAEALHQIRIRARKLRYVIEALETLRAEESPAPALLQSIQNDLGKLHDAHVLAEWLRTRAAEFAREGDAATAAEARSLARHFQARTRAQHRDFLATNPSARLASTIATTAPRRRSGNGVMAHANGIA